ncbi:hypothetical protein [Azospirillum sp. TSA6c]|uniref:hypothetical protein n=1 Tax=unclassified Azospirillum TaxID=2630922 RepID=UPI000D644869|nr:hypothetical protein [Azospirillum sp. TSA6c]
MEHYCTYFDKNYLSRGLALLDSLRRHATPFHLHILCLDAETHAHFLQRPSLDVTPVALETLEAFDPALLEAKANRRKVEYYFTCTPAWCLFLLKTRPDTGRLTYLDADISFFLSPSLIFDEIANSSVAIIPHRFSAVNYRTRIAGIFNVGWITWRRDRTGLSCLEEYRCKCLDWCYDYHDGTRFADQRYLDDWPSRYPNVHIIESKGANLAPWNIDTHLLTVRDGAVFVDDEPLIFYHFHGLKQGADGRFNRDIEGYVRNSRAPDERALDLIYTPYEHIIAPPSGTGGQAPADIRYAAPGHPHAGLPEWEYLPDGWVPVGDAVPGWNVQSVVDALEVRLQIMQRRRQATVPLGSDLAMHNSLLSFGYVAARAARGGPLSVLDWGGGLGIHAVAAQLLMPEIEIAFHCHEVPLVAARGRELLPEIHFLDDDAATFGRRYALVMANSALHYAEDWRAVLRKLAGSTGEWLYVSRLPMVMSVPSFVTLQRLFHTDYRTASPGWAINRLEFLQILSDMGFSLEREFFFPDRPFIPDAPEHVEYCGFLLRRGLPHSPVME